MDIGKLDSIIHKKLCPKCTVGMVRETSARVYACDHSQCGEIYDFSYLSDNTLRLLLDAGKQAEKR